MGIYVDAGATAFDATTLNLKEIMVASDVQLTVFARITPDKPTRPGALPVSVVLCLVPVSPYGKTVVQTECGETYVDAGAVAWDDCAGDISDSIVVENPVDVAVPGPYQVIYRVADVSGNEAIPIIVAVTVADTLKPDIELFGLAEMTLNCGEAYSDPGATAQDKCDGELAVSVSGSVNTLVTGVYEIIYSAVDRAEIPAVPRVP